LLNTRKADSPEWCAPTIVRLVETDDGYRPETVARGSGATVLDGRVAYFAAAEGGGCVISFGPTDWPDLYGSNQIGLIEPGAAPESLDLSATMADVGPARDLAWAPDGFLGLQTGGSLVLVDPDDPEAVLPVVPFGEPIDPEREGTIYVQPVFREDALLLAVSGGAGEPNSPWLTEWVQGSGVPYIQVNPSVVPLRSWARTLDASSTGQYVLWTSTPGEMPRGGYGPEDYRLSWLDRTTSLVTEVDGAFVDAAFAYPTFEPDAETNSGPESTTTSTTECIQKGPPSPGTPESEPEGAPLRVAVWGPSVPGTLVPFTYEKSPAPDERVLASPHLGLEQLTPDGEWEDRYTLVDVDTEPGYQDAGGLTTDRLTEAAEGSLAIPSDLEPGWYRLTTFTVVTDPLGVTLRTYTVYTLVEVPRC
jgi:hypothetical protein